MPTVKLYSTEEGKVVDHDVEADQNGEIVATYKGHSVKFPAGMTKTQFDSEVRKFNKRHEGIVAIPEEDLKLQEENMRKSQDLLKKL